MNDQSFGKALLRASVQAHIAWLFAAASLSETRRLNKIALLTPFLSVLAQAALLGAVYSALFGVDLIDYLPYLAVSLAMWQALSTFLGNAALYNDAVNRHLSFTLLSPYTIHLAGLMETMLLLLAKLAAAAVIIALCQRSLASLSGFPLACLGLTVVFFQLFFIGVLTAYLLDRFRLLRALLPQLIFLAFLVTPVIWRKEQLSASAWIADYNPLYHSMELVRAPLIGQAMPWSSLGITLVLVMVLMASAAASHHANRQLIVFRWVA